VKEEGIRPIQALHEEIWQERENAEATIKELHARIDQIRKDTEAAVKKANDTTVEAETAKAKADAAQKASEAAQKAADAKAADADQRMKNADEVVAAAGRSAVTAAKAEQSAQKAKSEADAQIAENKRLNAALKSQQDALLAMAEDAKHKQEDDAAMLRARWEKIFDGFRSLDPCKVVTPPCCGPAPGPAKTNWDGAAPKAETSVTAEMESGKRETDRIKTEPSPAAARLTGMSERSQAALE
jgi:membrane protein involved in colicin uptake